MLLALLLLLLQETDDDISDADMTRFGSLMSNIELFELYGVADNLFELSL